MKKIKDVIDKLGTVRHIVKEEDKMVIGFLKEPKSFIRDVSNSFNKYEQNAILSIADDKTCFGNEDLKSIVTCRFPDTYNVKTGFNIVDTKLIVKYYERLYRKYYNVYERVKKLLTKINQKLQDIDEILTNYELQLDKYDEGIIND